MYKSLVILLMLAGCAAGPTPERIAYDRYLEQTLPLARAGQIKWSTYYEGLYPIALAASAPSEMLDDVMGLLVTARQFEAGAISKDAFEDRKRQSGVTQQRLRETLQRQAAEQQARNQALGAAQMAAGLQMMQASQPQHYMLPIKPYQPPQTYGNAYATGYSPTQTINGSLKYCKYSNGQIITVASHELCPISTK